MLRVARALSLAFVLTAAVPGVVRAQAPAAPAPAPATPAPAAPAPAAPAPAPGATVTLTLMQALQEALRRSPEIHGSEAEVEAIRGKQLQALGIGRPQASFTVGLVPSPQARGNQVSSPDKQYSPDINGVAVLGGVQIIQPIFTWGLIDNARAAAEHGLNATKAGVDVKSTEVSLRVKQAYWGIVTARMLRAFIDEMRTQVDDALKRTERLVDGGYATEVDLYRFRIGYAELDRASALVEKTLAIARSALAAWTGRPEGTMVEAADKTLPTKMEDLARVEAFVQEGLAKRPEFVQLAEGIKAKQNLVLVEKKKRYPLFFVGIAGTAAYATNRDRLDNPYVIDPLYHWGIGPVLGFKYDLDFGIAAGKIKEAEAEVQKLEALQQYALDGVPLQVRDAYGTVLEAKQNVATFDAAFQNASKMLVAANLNSDIGVGEPRDLADAVVAYAKAKGDYLQALYAYVYGLEQLRHAAGLDVEEVRLLEPPR
jgi:outer membrane protein